MTDKADAWMPLWIGAYLADTQRLTTQQHGAYLLLLMAYWRERKALPDDDDELRAIVKADRSEWKRLRPKLVAFFTVADGSWSHKRVEKEIAEATSRKARAVDKAEKAAGARWKDRPKHQPVNAPSIAPSISQAMPEDIHEECPTPSPSLSSKEREPRATRLADSWALPDEWRAWAAKERPDLDPSRTAAKFFDYWRGKAGKDGRKLDWLATWRNWVRDERSASKPTVLADVARLTVPSKAGPSSYLAEQAAHRAEVEAERQARLQKSTA